MKEFEKQVKVLEGPWVDVTFPNGEETTNVISRKTITTYIQDGYLCESTTTRDYRDGDYQDSVSNKRITKING